MPSKYIFLTNLLANMIKYSSNLISLRVASYHNVISVPDRMLTTASTFRAVHVLSETVTAHMICGERRGRLFVYCIFFSTFVNVTD